MSSSGSKHILVAAMPAWGHNRPLLSFMLNLLAQHPQLHVTYMVFRNFAEIIHAELTRFHVPEDSRRRFKVVPIGKAQGVPEEFSAQWTDYFEEEVPKFLDSFFQPRSLDGQETFTKRPSLALVDSMLNPLVKLIRSSSSQMRSENPTFKIFIYNSMPISFIYWVQAAREQGGLGILALNEKAKELAASEAGKGRKLSEIQMEMWDESQSEGRLINVPGAPPMYNYELNPMTGAADPFNLTEWMAGHHAQMSGADGCIITTASELEPGARERFETLLGKRCIQVGPQFPEKWWRNEFDGPNTEQDKIVLSFLDQASTKYGEKSVLYISFGSVVALTKRLDILEALITSLLATSPPIPFLFAATTLYDILTPKIRELVQNSNGQGMICTFAPQMAVLNHSATGWFLSHAGSGSVSESVLMKVPMVFWPFVSDHPFIAAQLSMNLRLGFELIQIRTGPSIGKPSYRGVTPVGTIEAIRAEMDEMWVRIRGQEGIEVRNRVEQMGDAIKSSWESGVAKRGMDEFATYL